VKILWGTPQLLKQNGGKKSLVNGLTSKRAVE